MGNFEKMCAKSSKDRISHGQLVQPHLLKIGEDRFSGRKEDSLFSSVLRLWRTYHGVIKTNGRTAFGNIKS
jgi:hypothetical protein